MKANMVSSHTTLPGESFAPIGQTVLHSFHHWQYFKNAYVFV